MKVVCRHSSVDHPFIAADTTRSQSKPPPTMPDSYRSSLGDRRPAFATLTNNFHPLPARIEKLLRRDAHHRDELQLTRLVSLLTVVLLLTFGAVYKITEGVGMLAFASEMVLAFFALFLLATSYHSATVRSYYHVAVRLLCYLTALWFITLAALNNFLPDYAVGLLFILPGLGVGYSVTLKRIGQLVTFHGLTVLTATVACVLFGDSGIDPVLFVVSLVCISLVTLFVAAGRLDAEKQFHASEERYQAIVQQASDGICLLDAEKHTFLDVNPAFCRMIGRSRSELVGKPFTELLPTPEPVSWDQALRAQAHVVEQTLRRFDGSVFCSELRVDRIRYANRSVVSVVVQDVSKRKEYERRLVKAKEKAEEIARFKSTLLANMSHEIRTPLCSILGWAAVLNEEIPDMQRELVDLIEQSGRRLHQTLNSVFELARLESNTQSLQPIVVDVAEEVRSVVLSKRRLAAQKALTLSVHASAPDTLLRVDVSCLRRVLDHLVENAIKFTDRGEICVAVYRTTSDVKIEIRDTGIGISESFLPSIYDEFTQESVGLNRDHEGSGLGLAIVKRLVDLMGCRISVTSQRGQGSTFVIGLPLAAPDSSRTGMDAAEPRVAPADLLVRGF